MKTPNNIRIILTPVGSSERTDLENIENKQYSSKTTLAKALMVMLGEHSAKVLTVGEFSKECAFTNAHKSFNQAISNHRKKTQCYKLTDFMNDFNNQEFGEETEKYWMGYVKVK
jgi:glutathione peroxidase-family protein